MYDMLYTHKKKSENKINIFEIDLNGDIMMVNDTNSWIFLLQKKRLLEELTITIFIIMMMFT